MKINKMYEADDTLISIICDNHNILQSLSSFGINLGFGDKTVREVCMDHKVDTYTFLTIVNFTINGYHVEGDADKLHVPTLLHYLQASHDYYLNFELPFVRKELEESLDDNEIARIILRFYDDFVTTVKVHMKYEARMVFPYVQELIDGKVPNNYNIDTYSKHHSSVGNKLNELKNIIIKYLPSDGMHNHKLTATLYDIYNSEEWLTQHSLVEDHIFMPAIRLLEERQKQTDVSTNIRNMVVAGNKGESLSDRERDIVVCVAQGMANKEIADRLFISLNTVLTHRRNIARKLQIHTPSGLTIYAIINGLVDISNVKL